MRTKILLSILSVLLVIGLLFAFTACSSDNDGNDSENEATEGIPTEIIATFDSVEDLKLAIKSNPEYYNGKRVSVKAHASVSLLTNKNVNLYDDLLADDELYDGRARMRVTITDALKLAVLEDGDYIDLNGVITVTYAEFHMEHCTYSLIHTKGEHSYTEFEVKINATTYSTGLKERVCTACGFVDKEIIPAITLTFNAGGLDGNSLYIGEIDFPKTIITENTFTVPDSFITEIDPEEKTIIVKADDIPHAYYGDLKNVVTETLVNEENNIIIDGIKIGNINDYIILIEDANGDLTPVFWMGAE